MMLLNLQTLSSYFIDDAGIVRNFFRAFWLSFLYYSETENKNVLSF